MKTLLKKTILVLIIVYYSLFGGLTIVSQDKYSGFAEEIQLYENTYALIIEIDNYSNLGYNWQLKYAVPNAKAVAQSMRENFQFNEIRTLYNEHVQKIIFNRK